MVGGTLGSLAPPTIVGFSADDPDNADAAYGDGDVLTVRFDRAVGGLAGGLGGVGDGPYRQSVGEGPYSRAEVDRLFGFSTPLGADYRGTWRDASTISLELVDARGAGALVLGRSRVYPSVAADAVRLRNRAGCENVPEARCLTLTNP